MRTGGSDLRATPRAHDPTHSSNRAVRTQFIADQTNKRKIVLLGQTDLLHYPAGGPYDMAFHVDQIDVSHLARHVVANVGLLMATLYENNGQQEVVQVSMVTQVMAQQDGSLTRSIFSPLE